MWQNNISILSYQVVPICQDLDLHSFVQTQLQTRVFDRVLHMKCTSCQRVHLTHQFGVQFSAHKQCKLWLRVWRDLLLCRISQKLGCLPGMSRHCRPGWSPLVGKGSGSLVWRREFQTCIWLETLAKNEDSSCVRELSYTIVFVSRAAFHHQQVEICVAKRALLRETGCLYSIPWSHILIPNVA